MKKKILVCLLAAVMTLSGCGSILNREYSSIRPHSSTYYERGERNVLRAESYQDVVNDILVLVGENAAEGTIWLYSGEEPLDAEAVAEQASREVKEETPLGAYAVDYLSYTVDDTPRGHAEICFQVGYRRSEEQMENMIHATSIAALYDLLTAAAGNGADELAVQVSYFDGQQQEVEDIVEQVRRECLPGAAEAWQVRFYPDGGDVGIIEIIMKDQAE